MKKNNKKHVIVAIVGSSGSGKTCASFYLEKNYGWKTVVSYTTRPIRSGELDGYDHLFVNESDIPSKDKMAAYTLFGGHHYWATYDQLEEGPPIMTYVVDEKGLDDLRKLDKKRFNIVAVKIERGDKRGVEARRIERDNGRIELPDDSFDFVVHNNGTHDKFEASLDLLQREIEDNFCFM